jgi:hypothetical protein
MIEWAWADAVLYLDAYAMTDPIYDLAARAYELPLPPYTAHAMSHEEKCGGGEIGLAGHTIISLMVAAACQWPWLWGWLGPVLLRRLFLCV